MKPCDLIKGVLESEEKMRKEFKRKCLKKTNSLKESTLIQTSAYAIRNTIFIYHEEGLKEKYRIEFDVNDFIDENPKGIESLSNKISPYQEKTNYKMMLPRNMSLSFNNENDMKMDLKASELLESKYAREDSDLLNHNELWHEFDKIEIFSKYFIHNNFTIVQKKLNKHVEIKIPRTTDIKNKKRQSIQRKIQINKKKTIRPSKSPDFSPMRKEREGEKEKSFLLPSPKSLLNFHNRSASLGPRKQFHSFIEKYGARSLYLAAKKKILSLS